MAAAAMRANQRGRILIMEPWTTTSISDLCEEKTSRWSQGTKGAGEALIQKTKGALVKHKQYNHWYQKGVLDIYYIPSGALPNRWYSTEQREYIMHAAEWCRRQV